MMGKVLCIAVALLGIGGLSHLQAQLSTVHHTLSMDVKALSSGGASNAKASLHVDEGGRPLGGGWVTATNKDYTQKRNKESALGLDVELRNVGREVQKAKLDWYFIANPTGKGENFIFDQGSKEISVLPSGTEHVPLESKELHSSTVKELHTTTGVNSLGQGIQPSASVHKSGSTVGGWIVRLLVDDQVAIVRASSPSLEAAGQDDGKLAAFKQGGAARQKGKKK